MSLKTITIELRYDYDNHEGKENAVQGAVFEAARGLITTANLISDKRKAHIAVHASDFFKGTEEFDIVEETPVPST